MNVYWKDESKQEYAVLITRGFGSGWSSWNTDYPSLAYDKRVIEWYLQHNDPVFSSKINSYHLDQDSKEAVKFFKECGYKDVYFGGYPHLQMRWVAAGKPWRVKEYDGNESIEYLDLDNWIIFTGKEDQDEED